MSAFTELTEQIKSLQHTNKLLREDFIRREKELEQENKKLKNDLRLCAEGLIPHDLIQRGIVETCREEVKRVEEANEELRELIDEQENTILHLESEKDDLEKDKATLVRENVELGQETISRADHQKLVDFLNAEAEKYKVKYMEATGQLK